MKPSMPHVTKPMMSATDLSKAGTLMDAKVAFQMAMSYLCEKSLVICLEISRASGLPG